MTNLFRNLCLAGTAAAFLTLAACDGGEGNGPDGAIDRKPMLESMAAVVILPSYEEFRNRALQLKEASESFAAAPTSESLEAFKDRYRVAYLAWQDCSPFEFGPADAVGGLRSALNVFPTNAQQIEANIAAGSYNLDALSNLAAKGFPALDYLLYGRAEDHAGTLAAFEASPAARQYAADVAGAIHALANTVYNAWHPDGGNYEATFISLDGTDQGSSLGQLVNKVNEDYEIAKNFKLGLPAGIKTLGEKFPEKAEGYYSGLSLQLMKANIRATHRAFLGNSPGATAGGSPGLGFDDLLREQGASELAADIEAQFGVIFTALDAVPEPFSEAIDANGAVVQQAYDACQQLVVLTKTEMSSVFGVQISYQDGDND